MRGQPRPERAAGLGALPDQLRPRKNDRLGQTFLATPGVTGHGEWRRTGASTFVSRDAAALALFGFLTFDSDYELDRRGALAFTRTGFAVDPASGQRVPVESRSGSCERIGGAPR